MLLNSARRKRGSSNWVQEVLAKRKAPQQAAERRAGSLTTLRDWFNRGCLERYVSLSAASGLSS